MFDPGIPSVLRQAVSVAGPGLCAIAIAGACGVARAQSTGNLVLSPQAQAQTEAHARSWLAGLLEPGTEFAAVRYPGPCFECLSTELDVELFVASHPARRLEPDAAASVAALLRRELERPALTPRATCVPLYTAQALLITPPAQKPALLMLYPECRAARLAQTRRTTPYLYDLKEAYAELSRLLANAGN